jgi:hypothetical protein
MDDQHHSAPETTNAAQRLQRLRSLVARRAQSEWGRSHVEDELAQTPDSPRARCPRFAGIIEESGDGAVILAETEEELALDMAERLTSEIPIRPIELVDLDTDDHRDAICEATVRFAQPPSYPPGLNAEQEILAMNAGVATEPPGHGGRLTPAYLIATYCQPLSAAEKGKDSEHHTGSCGFDGHRGYDDGYAWMEHLTESGWVTQHDIGECPHSITMVWPALPADPRHAIARYLDTQLTIGVFNSHHAISNALTKYRAEEPTP